MDLRLLGPVEVRLDDRLIELGPHKQRAVLAMLALHVGRTVSTDHLVEGLWGEDPPSSAAKMVQLYVSHLRPLLAGSGAQIVTRNGGYELQPPEGEVDAVRFERLLEESRAREALALWRGDALADVAAEPFAAAEIRRLDELRLRAAETDARTVAQIDPGANKALPSIEVGNAPRALAAVIDRALRTPPAEALDAWAAADRRVVDLAAAVPMTNRRSVVLVSKRAGNVKTHAQWFTLLDQMWVR